MKVDILGVGIDSLTMDEVVNRCDGMFGDGRVHYVFTPNPEIIMEARDKDFKNILNSADMLLPDGIGVVIASKILKNPLPERVAGFDFICRLMETERSFYLLGGKPGVAEKAADILTGRGVNVVGFHDGYFKEDESVISDINSKKPDILLVCLGAPKQEKWIHKNRDKLRASLCVGAGGSIDVLAGEVCRAPEIYRKLNLEWLYRGIKQPQRLPRLLKLPLFLVKVIFGGKS